MWNFAEVCDKVKTDNFSTLFKDWVNWSHFTKKLWPRQTNGLWILEKFLVFAIIRQEFLSVVQVSRILHIARKKHSNFRESGAHSVKTSTVACDPIFLLQSASMSHIWLTLVPSLKKIWIVRTFQGNYLKEVSYKIVICVPQNSL